MNLLTAIAGWLTLCAFDFGILVRYCRVNDSDQGE